MIDYADDVSGWMEPYKNSAGAAGMLQLWEQRQGYTPDGPFLVLSGGDMWTGPAVPALTAGKSMTDIMNRTMYQSALGKQDFAFDLDAIHQRAAQAEFPFLGEPHRAFDRRAARFREAVCTYRGEWHPSRRDRADDGLDVGGHQAPVRRGPAVRGVQRCPDQVSPRGGGRRRRSCHWRRAHLRQRDGQAGPLAADLGVEVIGGGHCHEEIAEYDSGVPLAQSTSYLMGYNRLELYVDLEADTIVDSRIEFVENRNRGKDAELEQAVTAWQRGAASRVHHGVRLHAPTHQ